jgi:hypothetical protein
VVRGGDHERRDALVFEHLPHVLLALGRGRLVLGQLERVGIQVLVRVDDVGDLDVRLLEEDRDELLAADAGAHDGEADAVVGPDGVGVTRGG